MQRIYIILVFMGFSLTGFSQFNYKSNIPKVTKSGYYHILVNSDVLSQSLSDLSDIRIKDQKGKEIPYLLRTENPREEEVSFEYFELLENDFVKSDSTTRIVVDNTKREEINQFCIVIQSADIPKYVSLKGSDNGNNWYVVKQKTQTDPGIAKDNTSEILVINFPLGNYRYYEILISNPQNDPIRVLNVGKYKYSEILGKYSEIQLDNFVQADSSDKKTYIRFPAMDNNYYVDKIGFEIKSRTDYYRTARFEKQFKSEVSQSISIRNFTLSSKSQNIIQLGDLTLDKNVLLEIDNKDNPPLRIERITIFQLNRYLTVFLEEGNTYSLFFGDNKLRLPQYDIVYFEKDIPQNLPLLELSSIEKLQQQQPIEDEQSFFEKPLFMWIVIITVGILLLLMCIQIIKKSGTKDKN